MNFVLSPKYETCKECHHDKYNRNQGNIVDKSPIDPVKGGGTTENSARQAFVIVQPFLKVEYDVDGVTYSSAADRSA